jgi:hypothetical protein
MASSTPVLNRKERICIIGYVYSKSKHVSRFVITHAYFMEMIVSWKLSAVR